MITLNWSNKISILFENNNKYLWRLLKYTHTQILLLYDNYIFILRIFIINYSMGNTILEYNTVDILKKYKNIEN